MSRWARALIGALLGALIAFYVHPYSRERLLAPLFAWGPIDELRVAPELLSDQAVLPQPKTLQDYSLWMEAGAQRVLGRNPTSAREWKNLILAATKASQMDSQNGYWLQMRAVLANAYKATADAKRSWIEAARRDGWDDGQTSRLKALRDRLQRRYGEGAWTAVAVYPLRSIKPALAIESFARDISRSTSLADRASLRLRLATLLNGKSMRDGARSMSVAEVGAGIVELSSYERNLTSITSPRKLLLARTEFYSALSSKVSETEAEVADRAFRDNDSWLGFPSEREASTDAQNEALLSYLSDGMFSTLLGVSLLGVLLFGLSFVLRHPTFAVILRPPWAGVLGVGLAAITFLGTGQVTLALAGAAAFGMMAFAPVRERTRASLHLGPFHSLLLSVVGLFFLAAVSLAMATHTSLGDAVVNSVEWPIETLGGRESAISSIALALATLAAVSAFYSLVERISPTAIFANGLSQVGKVMAWSGITLAIVFAPLLLWADQRVNVLATQRLENEPVFYYVRT